MALGTPPWASVPRPCLKAAMSDLDEGRHLHGELAERPIAPDCKSGARKGHARFESGTPHHHARKPGDGRGGQPSGGVGARSAIRLMLVPP